MPLVNLHHRRALADPLSNFPSPNGSNNPRWYPQQLPTPAIPNSFACGGVGGRETVGGGVFEEGAGGEGERGGGEQQSVKGGGMGVGSTLLLDSLFNSSARFYSPSVSPHLRPHLLHLPPPTSATITPPPPPPPAPLVSLSPPPRPPPTPPPLHPSPGALSSPHHTISPRPDDDLWKRRNEAEFGSWQELRRSESSVAPVLIRCGAYRRLYSSAPRAKFPREASST
ncbi:protein enabled homolog [Ischnura elegans]|uniref:protein enabled homolog n=1 Tax=Ischnura elegans TaxID=197161 RepID=UPI001ED8A0EB|nr:protein enabled homolog [Ischnura elegans]